MAPFTGTSGLALSRRPAYACLQLNGRHIVPLKLGVHSNSLTCEAMFAILTWLRLAQLR